MLSVGYVRSLVTSADDLYWLLMGLSPYQYEDVLIKLGKEYVHSLVKSVDDVARVMMALPTADFSTGPLRPATFFMLDAVYLLLTRTDDLYKVLEELSQFQCAHLIGKLGGEYVCGLIASPGDLIRIMLKLPEGDRCSFLKQDHGRMLQRVLGIATGQEEEIKSIAGESALERRLWDLGSILGQVGTTQQ